MFDDFYNWLIHEKAMFATVVGYFIGSATNKLSGSINESIITPLINKYILEKNENNEINYGTLLSAFVLFISNLIIAYFISRFIMHYVKK